MDGVRQRDPYEVLGVPPDASEGAIRDAYRCLARRYHPDLHPGADDDMFQRVAAAYGVLGDRRRRRAYDLERGPAPPCGPVAQRRAPGPSGDPGPPRAPGWVDEEPSPPGPPSDEWKILSWVGATVMAAVLVAALVVATAALVLGGDHAILTLPGGTENQLCQTPDGWVDCRILDPSTP